MNSQEAFARFHTLIVAGREMVDDKTASIAPELYGKLKEDGALIPWGTRICWKRAIKKAAVDLWDREENNPDNAPTLWADLSYKGGYRIIPEVITAPEAFSEGEYGWWGDVLYRSRVNGNVYTPAVHPDYWETA